MTNVGEDQIASLAEITEDCRGCVLHFLPIVLATESLIDIPLVGMSAGVRNLSRVR